MFWEADGVKLGRRSALRPHAESQQKLITALTTEDERSRSLRHSMTRACNDPEFGWTNVAGKSHEIRNRVSIDPLRGAYVQVSHSPSARDHRTGALTSFLGSRTMRSSSHAGTVVIISKT